MDATKVPTAPSRCCGPRPWRNWAGTQEIFPQRVEHPVTLAELCEIVKNVTARSGRLRAVATGLSFSDILQTDDTLLETTGLLGEASDGVFLPLEEELWRRPRPAVPLVRIAAGARIRHLNTALARAGLAFTNLGGYDGQTIVGAISTSTHGSGTQFGPLGDGVHSLDLVTTGGAVYRLEPTSGITDPALFERRHGGTIKLVQDDDTFWSVVVSLGCMGVIHSVVMQVSPAFRLRERRRLRSWREVRAELATEAPLNKFRNYEVLVNPYRRRDDDYTCLVTERDVAPPDAKRVPLPSGRRYAESITFLASTQDELLTAIKQQPRLLPTVLELGLGALVSDETLEESFLIYNVGKINTADVVSGEYFYPLRGGVFLRGIDQMLAMVERNIRRGIYQTSPLAIRFVGPSNAPLSMTRRERHCTIEMSLFREAPGAIQALLDYERACIDLGGRPHWGQLHLLTGEPGWLRSAYPGLDAWMQAYQSFNSKGVFNNHFTDRLGLSMPMETRP
jgi:hypothetical protein